MSQGDVNLRDGRKRYRMQEPRRFRLAGFDEAGLSIIEVIIGALVAGIGAVGIAVMFSTGQASIQAEGDNRAAVQLAQERIQQIIATGFGSTSDMSITPDPRAENDVDLAPNHPAYRRTTTVTSVCPNNFTAPKSFSVACGAISLAGTEAKRFTVTVRATDGTRICGGVPCTDPRTRPVTLETVLVLH